MTSSKQKTFAQIAAGGGVFLKVRVVLVIFTGHSFAQTQETNSSPSALKK